MMNNVINIIQIVTIALNSMAARFISISMHKKEYEQANKYFNSVFYSNIIMSLILVVPTVIMTLHMNKIFDVPVGLLKDVNISFVLLMINFMLTICFSVFAVGTFITNRLDLQYIRTMISQCIRAAVTVFLFACFNPTIIFVSIATLASTAYVAVSNVELTKRLVPELNLSVKKIDKKSVVELLSAGVWNSIGTLSYDLFNGLDLIIANIGVSAAAMGVLSISKTIPGMVNNLVTTVVAIFMPSYVEFFAKKEIDKIVDGFETANKIMVVLIVPVLSFIIGFGDEFYRLWMPTVDSVKLQILTVLAVLPLYIAIGSKGLANIFTVANKIKVPTIVTFIIAACSTISVFTILTLTDLGIYAIAGVSSFYLIVKEFVFVPVYAAKCLNINRGVFFKSLIKSLLIVVVSAIISIAFDSVATVTGWLSLIIWAAISSIVICLVIVLLLFRKKDYIAFYDKLKKRKD